MKFNYLLIFLSIIFIKSYSQNSLSKGIPFVKNFHPSEYKAEAQNWSVTQKNDGTIYVANNDGVLEFDGSIWNLIPLKNKTVVRTVKCFNDTVYA